MSKDKEYRCDCDSMQLICQVHRHDPISMTVNPQACKDYWDRRDGINNEHNNLVDKSIKEVKTWSQAKYQKERTRHTMEKIKIIFFRLCKCIIDIDSRFFHGFDKNPHAFWANKWIFIRLFCGLIEFKFHLTNYAHSKPWYYGTGVRFRISICGIFKTHLIFNIGPWANEH